MLVDRKLERLYSLGPTDRYLTVPSGVPTNDLVAAARPDMRIRLRSAAQQAIEENARVIVAGGATRREGELVPFSIVVQPVAQDGEPLLLISFVEAPDAVRPRDAADPAPAGDRVGELERELADTRTELHGAIRNLERSSDELRAISENAL